ncbi:hypothetical protein M0R45_006637 [Rubus argutus]|uniref:TPX2 C-terminal domain-containing protein n=1 Tax=Rubus argutus TaxID=59490 RepID=A0AAW1YRG8_RUBAR
MVAHGLTVKYPSALPLQSILQSAKDPIRILVRHNLQSTRRRVDLNTQPVHKFQIEHREKEKEKLRADCNQKEIAENKRRATILHSQLPSPFLTARASLTTTPVNPSRPLMR